jgi:putative oxidoreductase
MNIENNRTWKDISMNTDYRTYLAPLGRLLLVAIFFLSGSGKVANPSGTIAFIGSTGAPLPMVGYALSVAIELGVSALFLIGYKTRTAAAVLALFCVATALLFHSKFADEIQMINFMKNIAMAGGFLQVIALGAGPFTLDARLSRSKQSA